MSDRQTPQVSPEERAHQNRLDILDLKRGMGLSVSELARLLKENWEGGYWKILGCDSFAEFLGDPEIGLSQQYAYQLIKLYKQYISEGVMDSARFARIGPRKLQLIAGVFGGDREWLDKAEHLSVSDLKLELGGGEHKMSSLVNPPLATAPDSLLSLLEGGCCVCDKGPAEKSHFPRTIGAGAKEDEWVPMCRDCHDELHRHGVDTFLAKYKIKIFEWWYGQRREWGNK